MPFLQAPAGARRILGGWQRSGWLWCFGRSCWWCSRRMTKRRSPAGSGRRRMGANERRVQSRSTPSEAKPGSLWTCGPVPSPVATPTDLHFESAWNGPVVISWIGREHELYSGASPISLVEQCVTFRHDRRLLSHLGFVHNWPTSRWSATKKKENRF